MYYFLSAWINLELPSITERVEPKRDPPRIIDSINNRFTLKVLNVPGKYLRIEKVSAKPNAPPAIMPYLYL